MCCNLTQTWEKQRQSWHACSVHETSRVYSMYSSTVVFPDDQLNPSKRHAIVADPNCAVRPQDCRLQTVTLVLIVIVACMLILYTLLWYGYMWKAFTDLQKHQYMHYKMGNLIVRMQVLLLTL